MRYLVRNQGPDKKKYKISLGFEIYAIWDTKNVQYLLKNDGINMDIFFSYSEANKYRCELYHKNKYNKRFIEHLK